MDHRQAQHLGVEVPGAGVVRRDDRDMVQARDLQRRGENLPQRSFGARNVQRARGAMQCGGGGGSMIQHGISARYD